MSLNLPQFFNSNSLSIFRDIAVNNENFIDLEIDNLSSKDQLIRLFSNLYYSWDLKYDDPTSSIYSSWINNDSPITEINKMSEEEFDKFWLENKENVKKHLKNLFVYLNDYTICSKRASEDKELRLIYERPIAYFSMEFGLTSWLHIYSGGLGVLAGDTLKQASDTGLPMIGVGIFYHNGYFIQELTASNSQSDKYYDYDPEKLPFEEVKTADGSIAEVEVNIEDHIVYVRAYKVAVGRRFLILLTTNFSKNERWEDRMITAHLYGGDEDTRIRQEIVLGIGGYKLLEKIGQVPIITHMNEGHSAFALIAITERIMKKHNISFDEALPKAKKGLVFTNHTLKAAGNDNFEFDLFNKYLSSYARSLGTNINKFYEIGTDEYQSDKFSMTIAGIENAGISNAVSILHAKAAKEIWPNHDLVPVTNGVHMPTWVGPNINDLLEKHLDANWVNPILKKNYDNILNISNEALWDAHIKQKQSLISKLSENGIELEEDIPIFSWFRRFTSYKRPDVIISEIEMLKSHFENPENRFYILFGGKAHPRDTNGRDTLKKILDTIKAQGLSKYFRYITEYNIEIAKYLVSGSDVWINTPRRHEEASGTSGMKAAANGLLQLTTLDGWTDELDWSDKGFVLDDQKLYEEFYNKIFNEVLPTYKDSNKWIDMMRKTIRSVIYDYSSERQLEDYINNLYKPVLNIYKNS